MAIVPTRILEIEFDAGAWTDVTADLVTLATRRGRNRELGAFETGTLTFTLRNDGRKYDPDNTAGPYYGKLRPNRRVRLRATYNAVTYPVFLGYIDRITQVYGGPNEATADFAVSDLFKLLNRVELPLSAYDVEVAADTPVALWRLGDPAGSTVAREEIGGYDLDASGAPAFGQTGMIVRDPGGAVTLANTDGLYRKFTTVPLTGRPFSFEFMYRRTASGGTNKLLMGITTAAPGLYGAWMGLVASTGELFMLTAPLGVTVVTTGANVNDLAAHHVVGTIDAAGVMRIYVDGVDLTGGATSSTDGATFGSRTGIMWIGWGAGMSGQADAATYQRAALYGTALSAARVAAHNTAARTPWRGDLPGTRLGRILDLAGVAAGDRTLDAGATTLQSTSLGGSALAAAQKVEETDLGRLFVTRYGKVRFVDRNDAVTGAYLTSKFTLVDADSGAGVAYRGGGADVDEATIVTRATVSRDGSVAVTYYDGPAKAEFGWIDDTHDGLLHDSDAYSLFYAQWIVNTHKTPASRVGTVTLELTGDPTVAYPAILDLEIGDRVTYKRKPQNIGAVMALDMRVEAIAHATGGHYWTAGLQLTPFNPGEGGWPVFVWDVTKWDQHVWGI